MFTNNWFQITAEKNFEKYVKPMKAESGVLNFLEIGCYEGQASDWMMKNNSNAELAVIDTFKGSKEHDSQFEKTLRNRFDENVSLHGDRITVFEGESGDMLKKLSKDHFDFIYVDGSHRASNVLEDAILAFPLLKKDGIMIFDDYTWGQGMDWYDVPANGINAFISVYGDQLIVLEKNSQVVIQKQ